IAALIARPRAMGRQSPPLDLFLLHVQKPLSYSRYAIRVQGAIAHRGRGPLESAGGVTAATGRAFHFVRANRAVLFVDIVESVRLIENDEIDTLSRWTELVEHVKTHVLPECGGRFDKNLGDGLLMDFTD